MIYIGMFFLSYFFMNIYERKNGNKYIKIFCLIIAILLPSILAGLRADTIGTDVLVYAKSTYNKAASFKNFKDYFNFWSFNSLTSDPLYFLATFVIAKIFPDYHFGLFAYQLFDEIFFFMGSRKISKKYNLSTSIIMLWIHLCLYNNGLNAIRQMIAVSLLFYCSTFLLDKKIKNFVIGTIIVLFCHSSGLLGFVLLGIFVISSNRNGKLTEKQSIIRGVLFIVVLLVAIVMLFPLTRLLVSHGIFRDNYLNYLVGGKYQSAGLARSVLVAPLIYLSIIVIGFNKMRKKYEFAIFFLLCAISNFAFSFGTAISTSLVRITYYFVPVVAVGMVMAITAKKKNRRIWFLFITIGMIAIWYIDFVVKGYSETYPYIFFWNA